MADTPLEVKKARLSEEATTAELSIGTSVRILDPETKQWKAAIVGDYEPSTRKHAVDYANGDFEWLCLSQSTYEVAGAGAGAGKGTGAVVKSPAATPAPAPAAASASATTAPESASGGRRRSSRSSAQVKRRYVFDSESDSDSDDEGDGNTRLRHSKPRESSSGAKRRRTQMKRAASDSEDEFRLSETEIQEQEEMDAKEDATIGEITMSVDDDDEAYADEPEPSDDDTAGSSRRGAQARQTRVPQDPKKIAILVGRRRWRADADPHHVRCPAHHARHVLGARRPDAAVQVAARVAPTEDGATYEMGDHWHNFQSWLYEDRRDGCGRRPDHPNFDPTTLKLPAENRLATGAKLTPAALQWWQFKARTLTASSSSRSASSTSCSTWTRTSGSRSSASTRSP